MNNQAPNINFAPPQSAVAQSAGSATSGGRAFAISSLAICGIGILPMLIFVLMSLEGQNYFAVFVMGLIGFAIHTLALIGGVVGVAMGAKVSGMLGIIGNLGILGISILVFFFSLLGW